MTPERVGGNVLEDLARFVAQRVAIAEGEHDAELIEEIHERGLAGVLDSRFAQHREELRQRATIVEGAMGLAGWNAITFRQVLQPAAGGVQRPGKWQRVVRREIGSARQVHRHSAEDREVEHIAVVRDQHVGAAEVPERRPH